MVRVAFKHIRASDNIGDTWCSPYDHIPELRETFEATVHDLNDPTPNVDAVIYGGGKITGALDTKMDANDLAARLRVAWGVSTVQKFFYSPRYARTFKKLDMIGSRDWGDRRFPFVPCASCMSPEFDAAIEETHEVVAYLHHWRAPEMGIEVPDHIPVMSNRGDSFTDAVRFIASGRTVVSNSYHGVYWGLLLGKRVLCLPFSNKFNNFRIAPGYSTAKRWQRDLGKANGSDEMLSICRDATEVFKTDVMDRLNTLNVSAAQ